MLTVGKSRKAAGPPKVGARFGRLRNTTALPGRVEEVAQVQAVLQDRSGIPHVRFSLTTTGAETAGPQKTERTLALATFLAMFDPLPEPQT